MSNELDFELIEDSTDGGAEVIIETDEGSTASDSTESKTDSEENTSSTKSKKSNFKKLSKLNKALKAENKRLREQANKDIDDDDDYDDEDDEASEFDRTEFRFFSIENPEAKDFSAEIEDIVGNNPNMTFEDALTLAKAKRPKTSTSSDNFNTTSANTKVRKRMADLTRDEALKLPNKKYLEWARLTGDIK